MMCDISLLVLSDMMGNGVVYCVDKIVMMMMMMMMMRMMMMMMMISVEIVLSN